MPILKSAKKQMRQSLKRRALNAPKQSELKTTVKKGLKLIAEWKAEEAKKFLPRAYRIIDMAHKRNFIHRNNAARKKSRLALALNELVKTGGKPKVEV